VVREARDGVRGVGGKEGLFSGGFIKRVQFNEYIGTSIFKKMQIIIRKISLFAVYTKGTSPEYACCRFPEFAEGKSEPGPMNRLQLP
jgi:hypothetical protein